MLLQVGQIQNWYLTEPIFDFKRNMKIQLFGVVRITIEQDVNVDCVQQEISSKWDIPIIMNLPKLTLPIFVSKMCLYKEVKKEDQCLHFDENVSFYMTIVSEQMLNNEYNCTKNTTKGFLCLLKYNKINVYA